MKLFSKSFDLKPAQPGRKTSGRGARCEADSPESGRGGTPRGGHSSPPFLEYGKAVASPPHPCKVLGFGLACRLGRPLGNVPPGRSGPLKRWTKLLLVSTQLAWRDPPLRNARRRLVLSGHGPRARAFGPASLRKPRRPKAAVSAAASVGPERSPPGTRTATCPVRSRTA